MDSAQQMTGGAAGEPLPEGVTSGDVNREFTREVGYETGLGWPEQPVLVDTTPGTVVGLGWTR